MIKINGISIERFCDYHHVEKDQVMGIIEFGLVQAARDKSRIIIPEDQVENLERFLRLANDLGVNMEGLEIINQMRQRILRLQEEIELLRKLTGRPAEMPRKADDDSIEFIILD